MKKAGRERELFKVIDSSEHLPQLPAFVYRTKINATDVYRIIGFEICWGGVGVGSTVWNHWAKNEGNASA